jgi:hypothetical protein
VRVANHIRAIRKNAGAWRALAREKPVNDENFFIAKIRDSESATPRFGGCARLARASFAHRARHARIAETIAAQAFSANLTFADVGGADVSRMVISTHGIVVANNAARALVSLRQHFLKLDAVFFDVLVYSEWSAFRFPSARSE